MSLYFNKCSTCGNSLIEYSGSLKPKRCDMCESKELEDEPYPRCPHCFRGDDEWHEFFTGYDENNGCPSGDGREETITCRNCEKQYKTTMRVAYTFDSEKIEKEDEKEGD